MRTNLLPTAVLAALAVASLACGRAPGAGVVAKDSSPAPTFDSAQITLSLITGPLGTSVSVSGSGFPPNSRFAVYVDTANSYETSPARLDASLQTDALGAFRTDIKVRSAPGGHHVICADTGYPGSNEPVAVKACAPFDETKITLSIDSAPPRTQFTIVGIGFPAGSQVALFLDSPNPYFGTPGPFADAHGAFSDDVWVWPDVPPGRHRVCGQSQENLPYEPIACADLTVEAAASPARLGGG